MKDLNIAVAQFQPSDGDKGYNLGVMDKLVRQAKDQGAQVISFHEMCITGYTHCQDLSRAHLMDLAEDLTQSPSCQHLQKMAAEHDMVILAGLVERCEGKLYNTYICVDASGLVATYRKLHPFISDYLTPGDKYVTFEIHGWKCGILICYDNNVIENVRATALLGADIIFAPHVTGCTPSPMPGRGYVDDGLWQQRRENPEALRREFDGPKGRAWIMRWLPARAYDNGVYYIFTNPIGYDGAHLKNGNSLILDPYGEVLNEVRSFDDAVVTATITADKLTLAGGHRYRKARRPELYRHIIGQDHASETKPVWKTK